MLCQIHDIRGCQSEERLRILARKKCGKSFGAEFLAKIPCRNSEPKFWHHAKTFSTKFWLEIFQHEILAPKRCRNSLPKFLAQKAISAHRCIGPNSQTFSIPKALVHSLLQSREADAASHQTFLLCPAPNLIQCLGELIEMLCQVHDIRG